VAQSVEGAGEQCGGKIGRSRLRALRESHTVPSLEGKTRSWSLHSAPAARRAEATRARWAVKAATAAS